MRDLFVICDSETTYSRRMSEYLTNIDNFEYDVLVFTSTKLLANTINDKKIKILVMDEAIYEELSEFVDISEKYIETVIVLSKDSDSKKIYKYQSVEKILESILRSVHEGNGVSVCSGLCDYTEKKSLVKEKVQEKLLILGEGGDDETLKTIDDVIESECEDLSLTDKTTLRNKVFYSIRGLDVLEELISDEGITEIMVNGEKNIFYEKNGSLIDSHKCFDSREQLLDIIQKIVSEANRTVNRTSPIVDARLRDGSRVNVVLEPISLDGPTLTIRRFPEDPLTAEKLIRIGAVSEEIISMLRKLVYAGYNILISGSTGSGKTTFLNILSSFIPKDERIITIEDSAELKIMGIKNLVRMEARNASTDGTCEITIRDLIKAALRMRPDRIIVGEVRGEEAIDMLQSFTVGQEGSMSTIHANSAEDALYRLEMLMMLGSVDMPLNAIRRQISIGVDIIIQLGRLKGGDRRLMEIIEVIGMEEGRIKTNVLYKFGTANVDSDSGVCSNFEKCGEVINTYKLEKAGY